MILDEFDSCDMCGAENGDCDCDFRALFECDACGCVGNEAHSLDCPENISPYANLLRDGYD